MWRHRHETCTTDRKNKRLQSVDALLSVKKKLWYLDVVFSDAYPTIASWAETGDRGIYPGNPSPRSLRKDTRPSEKNRVKLRRCLKYHTYQLRYMIYLNKHWQSTLDSAVVRETSPLAEPPIMGFTDAKIDCSKKENKIQHFFYISPIFGQTSVAIQ